MMTTYEYNNDTKYRPKIITSTYVIYTVVSIVCHRRNHGCEAPRATKCQPAAQHASGNEEIEKNKTKTKNLELVFVSSIQVSRIKNSSYLYVARLVADERLKVHERKIRRK